MTYYLAADSTRGEDGKRYKRADPLPDELGKALADRGFAVTDLAELRERRQLPLQVGAQPKREERSTIGVTSADGVGEEGTVLPVNDSTAGAPASGSAADTDDGDAAPSESTAKRTTRSSK